MKKILALLSIVLLPLLFSCGGPRFVVKYKFVPPEGKEACLKDCEDRFNNCFSACEKKREKCLKEVRKEAERIYNQELANYSKKLSDYNKALANYQQSIISWNEKFKKIYRDYLYFKRVCKQTKHYLACERKNDLESLLEELNSSKPVKPTKPQKPDFYTIYSKLSSACQFNCGCEEKYKACFLKCGGKIIPYKFCVENCK